MLDRRQGTQYLAWGAVFAPLVAGLLAFFWGQASAGNTRLEVLERRDAAVGEILKSIDMRLERIENRLDGKKP